MKALSKLLILVVCCSAIFGCKKKDKTSIYTVGFSQCVGSDLWRRTMLDEMKMELSLHPGVRFIYADAEGNSRKQVQQVKNMVDQGIDILIISPNEAQPLTGIVEQTYNKGIPVIVIDRKTASTLYTAYVGADNVEVGRMAGEYMGNLLKRKGNVIEIMGLPGSSPAIERERGFADGLKKFPNVHIVRQLYGDWLKDHAEMQLSQTAALLPVVDAIFAHNDVMASGARAVLNARHIGKKIRLIGVDALPGQGGGLQMIDSKIIDASLLYPTGGKEAIVTAFKILNKEPFLKENILQSQVIDSTNAQLMKLQWNRIASQHNDILRQQNLLTEQENVYNSQQTVLNIIVISLVLAVVFGGLAFYSLVENRKINKALEKKNIEILEQRNQLVEMSARAQAATEAKLNFFTNMSHEFRTPLTLILSPVEDMMANEKLNLVAGKSLKMIRKNAFRLLKLVNQLIDYRKIEYDRQLLSASPANIVSFIKEIVDSFRQSAEKRGISIKFIAKEPKITVWFDINLLDKVFFNLLSNAIKFTNDNGTIMVTLAKSGDELVEIKVNDSGIGMEADELAHVFEQFYQSDGTSGKGSGLGLSLSKEIVNLHQGTLEVSSKKWQGTTFTIRLKMGNEHLQLSDKTVHIKPAALNTEKLQLYIADLEKTEPETENWITSLPKEHSLLIVEDNPDLLGYLSDKLSSQFDIYSADNGNAGISMAFEHVPDLIISDIVLPGASGKNLTELLKTDMRTSHIPIILLTAQSSTEQQIDGIRSMADAYITKPFNFNYLSATVENLIRNRVLLKEHFISDAPIHGKQTVSKSLDKKFLNDFAGIVEQNLSNENFSVDDVCKAIGISRVQLYRKVKALLDCSITDYILARRLKKAKYLLTNECYSIGEITYMVGFSTPNYFSTVFKNKYGCTPSEFKKAGVS
ncbi:MAG: hybrid sensor histidine kinase/response regulator transcription factor [Mucilaginibacter sp.]